MQGRQIVRWPGKAPGARRIGDRRAATAVVAGAAALLFAGGALAAAPALAEPAPAVQPTCGETLVSSVTLTANLNCSSDTTTNALNIGAADITVNLNGHTIEGPGDSTDDQALVGIYDGDSSTTGYSGLLVTDGTISDYSTGVGAGDGNNSALTDIQVTKMHFTADSPQVEEQVLFYGVDGGLVHGNTGDDAYVSYYMVDCSYTTVSDNTAAYAFGGVVDIDGYGDILSGNKAPDSQTNGVFVGGGTALEVRGNSATGANSFGLQIQDTGGSTFNGNTMNHVAEGIVNEDPTGTSNSWQNNNTSRDGIGVYDENSSDTYTGSTTYDDQVGIYLDEPDGTTVTGSHSNYDSQEGVDVYTDGGEDTDATVTNDTASHDRYGFYADAPITTSSGNTATKDSQLACYNIECNGDVPSAERPTGGVTAPWRPAAPAVRDWYARR